ncbi:MAG: Fic family protein [Phycisphaerae bacterium]|nr:Fic family protein [Phycisphaerae bacterium]
MDGDAIHSGYDGDGGLIEFGDGTPNRIDPPGPFPKLSGVERYRLSTRLLGQLERLAQARFFIQELTHTDFERWTEVDEQSGKLIMDPSNGLIGLESVDDILQPIAQSVFCSSAIEGEQIHRKSMDLAIIGKAHVPDNQGPELDERATAIHSIYRAYIWALSRPSPLEGGAVLTPEFIREVHRRMFSNTKGDQAGRYKTKDNKVRRLDGTVLAFMLPHQRVPELMEVLCDRINAQFLEAERHGSVSKLLSIAEFVSDYLGIHPFADGNGRTARLLCTYLLERAGYHFARFYTLDAVILERHLEYYRALLTGQRAFYTDKEDLTHWIEYFTDCVFVQWLRAYQYIKSRR